MNKCNTCLFYEELYEDDSSGQIATDTGYCRKNPPSILDVNAVGRWPIVLGAEDWCGHRKEVKE